MALRRDGTLIAARSGDASTPHAARLPAALTALLAEDGATLDDVGLLAVGLGPGAFTGLRVGLATMQGLAFATSRPIVGISGLDALAVAAARAVADASAIIGVWLDAARQEVFAARYRVDSASLLGVTPLDDPLAARPAAVLDAWGREEKPFPDVWIGGGAVTYREVIDRDRPGQRRVDVDTPLLAPLIAELGERVFRADGAAAPHALRPLYVRRPDAELARGRSLALGSGP